MTNLPTRRLPARFDGALQAGHAELIKLRSVRSTWWTLLATGAGTLLVTVLVAFHTKHQGNLANRGFDPTNRALTGLVIGSLVIGVLGALAVTGEYGSGTMRSSLAAVPRRPLLLAAKVAVVGAISLVVGEILCFACFGIGQAIFSGHAPTASIGQPGVLRALLLSGAYLALLGVFGLGLGVIIRHTAGAISAFVAIAFLLPVLLQSLGGNLGRFTPEEILSNSVAAAVPQPGQLSAAAGFLMMVAYCAVVLTAGTVLFVRRDA